MNVAAIDELGADVRRLLGERREAPLLLTLDGRPIAVVLGLEDAEDLDRLKLWFSPEFQAMLEASREQHRSGLGIDHDTFWTGLESAVEETS